MTKRLAILISEGRGADCVDPALIRQLTVAAAWPNVELTIVPHLYDLAPDGAVIEHLQSVDHDMVVLAHLYPRAAYWVLDANRIQGRMGQTTLVPEEEIDTSGAAPDPSRELPDRTIWCIDLRPHGKVEPLLEELARITTEVTGDPVAAEVVADLIEANGKYRVEEETALRWYPVVDYERCGNCLECLNFCLFGVFGVDEADRLIVEQPDECRNGCPACSRVCPSQAIMFPQHHSPTIAGDPSAPADGFNLDLTQLLGPGGPTPAPQDQAAAERDRALAEKAAEEKAKPKAAKSEAKPPADKDDLDALVDDLDEMEL